MNNLNMDLTGGTLPNYKVKNRVFSVFRMEQFIDFGTPVYADSIQVYLISDGRTIPLVLDDDYMVPDEAILECDNDMSSARLQRPDFNHKLTSGITMLRGVDANADYRIAVSYQRLYPNQIQTAQIHGTEVNVTPELLVEVLTSIEQLKILTNQVTDTSSLNTDGNLLLEMDVDKTNENNYIEDEAHLVNTSGGRYVIRPKGGDFYRDSVTVKHPGSGSTLIEGEDYEIVGISEAHTKITSYPGEVCQFIIIKTAISDTVTVSYHAFGGEPTLDNYEELLANLNNLTQFLNASGTLTSSSLGNTDVIQSLINRITSLEADMRRLQGTPAYGDITSGKCILMKIFSEQPGMHWYTIATLYNTEGSNMEPCVADTFNFRLQTQLSHFQCQVAVAVDTNNNSGDCLNVNVISENYPRGYIPFEDYSSIDKIIQPQIRAVWKRQDTVSGIALQLGFELKGMVEETVAIEDMSGHESCWKLVEEKAEVTLPQDDNFLLPDGLSTWSTSLANSYQESMLIPFKKGHLIWAGNQPMNRPTDGWLYFELDKDNLLLNPDTDIRRFSRLRLDIEEKDGLQFPIDVLFNSGTNYLKGHASFTHQNDPVYVNAELSKTEKDGIHLRLNWEVVAGISSNELDLKDLVIYC